MPSVNISTRHEIIKVREGILHIGLIPKVVPLKLVLDILQSSSKDISRALRVISSVSIYHTRE